MLTRNLGALAVAALVSFSFVACAAPQEDAVQASSTDALTVDSVGLVCRTLGEIGQCGSTGLCRSGAAGKCRAKPWTFHESNTWESFCNSYDAQNCKYASQRCLWETQTTCTPSTGTPAKTGPTDITGACTALGELGACGGVTACKSSTAGVCRASDDASVLDPQWIQMCPHAGTSPEACDAQGSNCVWDTVQTCTPRGTGKQPIDLDTACKTLGQAGACGLVPSVCKQRSMGLCSAAPGQNPQDWEGFCNGYDTAQNCGYTGVRCTFNVVNDCIAVTGSHFESTVDSVKACDTFGQMGLCSKAPICKTIASATCRGKVGAVAADPSVATQCAQASASKDTCDFLGESCEWAPTAVCVPR